MRLWMIPATLLAAAIAPAQTTDTEARAVLGLEQTAASAATPDQKLFFDFFIDRSLSMSWMSLWGDVEVASFPQQISTPLAEFDVAASIAQIPVSRLAESSQFSTGIDVHPFKSWPAAGGTRRFGFVLGVGATSPLPPSSRLTLFAVPAAGSPQYSSLIAEFPQAAGAAYIGFLPVDRARFYRNWGAGFRLTTEASGRPAAMYTLTLGQDELVSGGKFHGGVAKFDVFYPLPLKIRGYNYLYLFGTANMRLTRADNLTPLVLAAAPSNLTGSEPSVALAPLDSARDVYRVGFGVDAVGMLCAIFQGKCN